MLPSVWFAEVEHPNSSQHMFENMYKTNKQNKQKHICGPAHGPWPEKPRAAHHVPAVVFVGIGTSKPKRSSEANRRRLKTLEPQCTWPQRPSAGSREASAKRSEATSRPRMGVFWSPGGGDTESPGWRPHGNTGPNAPAKRPDAPSSRASLFARRP